MRRACLLLPLVLIGAACAAETEVNPDHQTSGEMVTVTPFYDFLANRCADGSTVRVFEVDQATSDEREVTETDTADASGNFAVTYATGEPGTFDVRAECAVGDAEPFILDSDYLVVEPVLTMEADPTEMEPGATFTLTGNWCVSQFEDSDPPVVQVTYLDEELDPIVAESPMPFDETWTLELVAPDEDGTYDITATCIYDDDGADVEEPPIEPAAASDPEAFPDAQIVVATPEVPTEPTEPTQPTESVQPAETPRALPAQAQPAFTG